jgi:pimeloyl-ACP methyl ester carboxylesterase
VSEKSFRSPRQKRTNVRFPIRAGMRLFSWIAPQRAEALALQMFATPRRPARPAEPSTGIAGHRFTIEVAGQRLTAWDWGRGPTVILTHGWSGHSGQMASFVGPLVRAGYYVVAFDHPAHGQSEGKRATYLDVAAALTAVARRVGPVHAVIGHSFGCTATILALTRGLAVDRVVMIAPPAESPMFARAFGETIGLPAPRIDGMIDRIRAAVGGDLDALDARRLVSRLHVPALIIHDPADREVPFAHAQAIAAAWPGARLHRVEGLGHNRLLRDPAVVERTVQFVNEPESDDQRPALSVVQ